MKKNNVIDESKKELLREVLNYSDEFLFEELTPRTLKKMHNFLVEHKCAETFKEIKSKNQINIKGCGPNGLERLIGKEIREQYGLDILEASEKFTTFYPIFSEGVIKYESVNGLHYTHFKVSGQTEKTFGMEIKEYKLYHNVFYLTYSIRIKEMSKHIPFYLSETVGEDIRHLLFSGPLSEEVDKEFSELEKLMIRHTINNEQNYEEEMTIILYNTIANFRAVNFLWEKYNHDLLLHSISSDWFYDNEFFKINNWRYEIQGINDLDELYQKRLEDYCDYILNSKDDMMVLRKNTRNVRMRHKPTYPNIDMQRTGRKIKHMIESSGYTPRMIQDYLQLSCVQPIYRWYKGLILPSVDHLFMLSELLNVHMEDFLVKKNAVPVIYDIEQHYSQVAQQRLIAYYKIIYQSVA